jgi:hypothetical protein
VDGNTDGYFLNKSTTHTEYEISPTPTAITTVAVFLTSKPVAVTT